MDQVLGQIQTQIPRVFVNLVSLLNISQVYTTDQTSEYCKLVEHVVDECPCLTAHGPEGRRSMDNNTVGYNKVFFPQLFSFFFFLFSFLFFSFFLPIYSLY